MGHNGNNDNEMEIDLIELAIQLINNWMMIGLITLLAAVIGFTTSRFLVTPQYESTSQLYVLSKSTSLTSLADIQMGTSLTNDYLVVVTGRPVLEQVAQDLNLEMEYNQLKEIVSVSNPTNSRILNITVKHPDPYTAKAIADEIADVSAKFIAQKMDQDPPTVIQYGYADGKPVSPSVGKNTLIGGLLGFLLASAIVIVTYLLDDSIMNAEDVEKKLGVNVLGSLPLTEEEYDGEKSKKKIGKHKKTA